MNNVSNSDSEQCPESKLGWVHTHGPGCTLGRSCRGTHWHHVADLARPCRGAHLTVWRRTQDRVATQALPCRALCRWRRDAAPPCALPCVSQLPAPYRGASCVVSWRFPRPYRTCLTIQSSYQASLLS